MPLPKPSRSFWAACCTCRPTNQFCCGCSLKCGARLILILNLVLNVFYIATATANIILKVPTIGFGSDMTHQVLNAAFCLFGLPFIAAALYGVSFRQESHVRLYLYYLLFSFVLDMGYVLWYMFVEDTCKNMPTQLASQGSAFACGMTRIISLIAVVLLAIIQGYCMFVIWSVAEDIRATGTGAGFPELLENARKAASGTYGSGDGLFGTFAGPTVAARALNYGSLAAPQTGGGSGLFGGEKHDVSYPPKSA